MVESTLLTTWNRKHNKMFATRIVEFDDSVCKDTFLGFLFLLSVKVKVSYVCDLNMSVPNTFDSCGVCESGQSYNKMHAYMFRDSADG